VNGIEEVEGDRSDALLREAEEALEDGNHRTAERRAREILAGPPTGNTPRAMALLVRLFIDTEREDEALESLRHLREAGDPLTEADFLESRLRIFRWDLDAASRLLATDPGPEVHPADVLYHRALLAELRGEFDEADRLFSKGGTIDSDICPRPERLSEKAIHRLVDEATRDFPPPVAVTLSNVVVEVADLPDRAIDGPDVHPHILGIYHGLSVGDKSHFAPYGVPDRIRIFKRNVERLAGDRDIAREELRITLLHEIGHHLGFDEEGLEEMGLR
jgi:predicted Zn-dependent protease with MMP-like domain